MNRKSAQVIKNSQVLRANRQGKQVNQRYIKNHEEIEAAIKIQKWWQKIYKKIVKNN